MRDLKAVPVLRLDEASQSLTQDEVVVEEPLEIRVNGTSMAVTMRTPGDDFDLARGLLWTEGVIHSHHEIATLGYCPDEDQPELKNIISVGLIDTKRRLQSSRASWSNSSCGLCGRATLDAIRQVCRPIDDATTVRYEVVCSLPARLHQAQANFARTGGIHAVALFDVHGNLLLLREDIGRHNAVDKVLGAALVKQIAFGETLMMVSGRLGFEIAQKAVVAGIPVVASISAPSSLALELANEFQMTAIGFVRGRSMNVYTHGERVKRRV